MKNSKDLLSSALKTSQMGKIGIASVMDYANSPLLRQALNSQMEEYRCLETSALQLAQKHGIPVSSIHPGLKSMARAMAAVRLTGSRKDSRIAAMTIRGNTMGLIKGTRNRNHYDGSDMPVWDLCGRLLKTEEANIRQMEKFL